MDQQVYVEAFSLNKYLVASSVSAFASRLICHPFDTIKVNFQESAQLKASISHLYRGFVFSLLTTIPALSLFLVTYEQSKLYLQSTRKEGQTSSFNSRLQTHMMAAGIAEVVSGVLWTPSEIIKQHLQTSNASWTQYLSFFIYDSVYRIIYSNYGIKGFARGYFYSIWSFLPTSALYFGIFEELNYKHQGSSSFHILLKHSFIASLISTIVTSPLDLLKTRRQFFHLSSNNLIMIRSSLAKFNLKGLLINALVRSLWNVPSITISIASYEYLKKKVLYF